MCKNQEKRNILMPDRQGLIIQILNEMQMSVTAKFVLNKIYNC